MKKIIAVLLAALMCLALTACGGEKSKTLTVTEVQTALKDSDGTLGMNASGDIVNSFTYVVADANKSSIMNRNQYRSIITAILAGNSSQLTYGEYMSAKAFMPLLNINSIFYESEEGEFNANEYLETLLDVICDGKALEYGNWTISASIDAAADTVTFSVSSK